MLVINVLKAAEESWSFLKLLSVNTTSLMNKNNSHSFKRLDKLYFSITNYRTIFIQLFIQTTYWP